LSCYYTALPDESLLHLQGPDALTFLQGQLTCDTRRLEPGRALPGLYCTVQGRVICDFLLCSLAPEHLALRLRRDIWVVSTATLAKYIVFSRAELATEREDWAVSACWGEDAAAVLKAEFGQIPDTRYGASRGAGYVIVQVDDAGNQFECLLQQGVEPGPGERLRARCTAGSESQWRALQIAAGVARIEATTSGEYVPQMLNYDLTGHISFNKGCYTGQEVVARLHYRGKPKRRLYLARLAGVATADQRPAPGDPLYGADDTRAIGNIVNLAVDENEGTVMLVTTTAEGLAGGLHLGGSEGPALAVTRPPYPLPEA